MPENVFPAAGKRLHVLYSCREEVILGKMLPISKPRAPSHNTTLSGLQHVKADKACNCFTPPAELSQIDSVDREMANRKTLSR